MSLDDSYLFLFLNVYCSIINAVGFLVAHKLD